MDDSVALTLLYSSGHHYMKKHYYDFMVTLKLTAVTIREESNRILIALISLFLIGLFTTVN